MTAVAAVAANDTNKDANLGGQLLQLRLPTTPSTPTTPTTPTTLMTPMTPTTPTDGTAPRARHG